MKRHTHSRGLTRERLQELLAYDQATGIFTWRVNVNPMVRAGSEAGKRIKNKIVIKLGGLFYLAHHLAWFYMTGEWPSNEIDHRNVDGYDNSFENLRIATASQNNANRRLDPNRNSSGYKGVSKRINKSGKVTWQAQIRVNYKYVHLGSFLTAQRAHEAYVTAARQFFGEFARAA